MVAIEVMIIISNGQVFGFIEMTHTLREDMFFLNVPHFFFAVNMSDFNCERATNKKRRASLRHRKKRLVTQIQPKYLVSEKKLPLVYPIPLMR